MTPTAHERRPAPAAGPGRAVRFPQRGGRRSTTASARGILADAARATDRALAERIEGCGRWRRDYVGFVRELTALAAEPGQALAIASAGIESMRARLVLDHDERQEDAVPLGAALSGGRPDPLHGTGEIRGGAPPAQRLEVPYRGELLHGASLDSRLAAWTHAGTVEPSFADAVRAVAANPEWLSLPGRTVALVGAGSEIGPLAPLCAWGADVVALDLPSERVWTRIGEHARAGAGRVRVPVARDGTPGIDVLGELEPAYAWLGAQLDGCEAPLLGMYGYADGGPHVLLTGAFDALAGALASDGPAPALAFLATPTDSYLVPEEAVERARAAWRSRRLRRLAQAPLRLLSGGRLFRPAYASGEPVADALVEQQGPNYALAKRLQRWRGVLAAAAGEQVSFNVAPATRTRSVTRNRVLAAAYAGAGLFGVEVFEPATTRVLMAALLVHDLHAGSPPPGERLFSDGAAHGGLWTAAYEPRSVLGLAALAGLPAMLAGGGS